ncbi:PAS domain S-box protein [Caballeronia sp. LZ016]|uniref:PAS domain S-box protein n=1 Tax=Caballeronia sp. LZ016 TaxID=3038554 RepID=UPI00285628D9|nr:PAS domain S-box protein [Caballeronia sp. LZ016]MDR5740520.1 PAS domain S-box protein [Caballeronia sp. LZ016]
MQVAPLPFNENDRLRVLRSLAILDTPAEEVFDRLTRVLAHMLHVPMALITFIDSERQWFKSRVGVTACETSREVAFCAHALTAEDMLVVEDARRDPRFRDNPAVTGPMSVRFYAGVPLRSADGYVLGTLCAIDTVERSLSHDERAAMRDLARTVERELLSRETAVSARALHEADAEAIHRSEARFRTIFQQTPTGAAIVDLDGGFIDVNPRLCEMVGYSADELLARTFQQITAEEDLEHELLNVADLLAGRIATYTLEKRYLRKDGIRLWIQLHVSLVRDGCGDPLHFIAVVEDIGVRKENERLQIEHRFALEEQVARRTAELRAQNTHLQAVIDNAQDAYVCIDDDGNITEWNDAAVRMFGWTRHEALGRPMTETIIPPEWRDAHVAGMRRFLRTKVGSILSKATEVSALRRSGETFPAELRISTAATGGGHTLFAFITDVSERKRVEAEVVESREAVQKITDSLPVLIAYVDRDLRYQFNNDGYRRLIGMSTASMRGQAVAAVMPAALYRALLPSFRRALAGERVQCDDIAENEVNHRTWSFSLVPDLRGREVIGFYMMAQDVTDRKKAEQRLVVQAMRDALTGLPNRRALSAQLNRAIAADASARRPLAVFFLDLDGFKAVNDAHGHEAGDALLQQVGKRLQQTIRSTDFVARLAGDEFVILSHGVAEDTSAARIAESICEALRTPFHVADHVVTIATSVGAVVWDGRAATTPDALLAAADKAMYEVKRKGRNGYRIAARSRCSF